MSSSVPGSSGLALREDADGLVLTDGVLELRADLAPMAARLKPANLARELLVRAARVKGLGPHPRAVDATAGLGEDALLLAAAGFSVDLYERDPVIAALLRDALRRAAAEPALADAVGRMTLHEQDSIAALPELAGTGRQPDVVLLDPMFPAKRKGALTNKKLQLFQRLETPCPDEEALMGAALAARPARIVAKRPLKGPHLAGVKPSHSIAGKVVRYDCIVPRG